MGDEGHPAEAALPPAPDPPSDDRAETVRADGEPCGQRRAAAILQAHPGAGDAVLVLQQVLDRHALAHISAGGARRGEELGVEDAARDGEPGRAERVMSGEREAPVESRPAALP